MKKLIVSIVMVGMMGLFRVGAQQAQPAAPAVPPAPKSWADGVTVKGDVRYRYESINDDSKLDADKETFERQRDRIRARLGVEGKISDTLKAGIEFSTGQSDPVSGNQTLGDGFNKKPLPGFVWVAPICSGRASSSIFKGFSAMSFIRSRLLRHMARTPCPPSDRNIWYPPTQNPEAPTRKT